MSYAVHPLAALVPEMAADQFAELRADIERNGLMHPIVLHEHMVLDGRHRLRACEETGVDPRFEDFNGPSPVEFVLSANVKRRHLTPSQRAALAVAFLPALEEEAADRQRVLGRERGGRPRTPSVSKESEGHHEGPAHRAAADAGAAVGVSRASVARAKRVQEQAPEMFEQVKSGAISVTNAETRIREAVKEGREPETPAVEDLRPVTDRDVVRANFHKRKVIDLVSMLSGFARGLDDIDVNRARAVMDEAELREWDRSLGDSLSKLRGFRSDLQKGRP